ncbi:MAG: filamentous hemagglutinin N-terminal domain-containing protein, partial [Robiginitomaculum sp.]|nr:filamentous hemagglutinin N-terminal domain-containing protein [Robiginitomaculum sp.]
MTINKKSVKRRLLSASALCGGAIMFHLFVGAPTALADPLGGVVSSGTASIAFEGTGGVVITQTTDKGLITWTGGFNIANGESATFIHLGAAGTRSVTVNRDVTGTLSTIDGLLRSCLTAACLGGGGNGGSVWIINPAGVAFGANAIVNVGGLMATTADIADIAGFATSNLQNLQFVGNATDGSIIVDAGANITGTGSVIALIAPTVRSSGTITNPGGDVLMGSAQSFTISFADAVAAPSTLELFSYRVDAASTSAAGLDVSGDISSNKFFGSVVSTVDSVLNVDANITATAAIADGTAIVLVGGGDFANGVTADPVTVVAGPEVNLTINGMSATGLVATNGDALLIGSNVNINDTLNIANELDIRAIAGDVVVSADAIKFHDIQATSNININVANDITGGGTLNAGGNITTNSTGSSVFGAQTATGFITATAGTTYTSGLMTSGTATQVTGGGNVTIAGASSGSTLNVVSNTGDVSFTANSTSVGNTTLTSTLGSVTTQDVAATGGNIILMAATGIGGVNLNASGNI